MTDYKKLYDDFITTYTTGQTSGEETGAMVAMMAQCYCEANIELGRSDRIFAKAYAIIVDSIDEASGKPMSVSKADVLAKATEEYSIYSTSKVHLQNIEQCINALKSLQKGILNEYSHVSSI